MKKQLFVHIGLHKTGSSAIQAWLARHSAELHNLGFGYHRYAEDAAGGAISSGNGPALAKAMIASRDSLSTSPDNTSRELLHSYFGNAAKAIVSSEMLVQLGVNDIRRLKNWCESEDIDLRVLAYVRHVYDHCYSAYQQHVKGNGYTATFLEFSQTYENTQCSQIARWHSVLGRSLRVASYDKHKSNLLGHFTKWAQLPKFESKPATSGSDRVNRSLSYSELELIRCLNSMHRGKLNIHIYRRIIHSDPLRKQDYFFSKAIYEDFTKRFSTEIQQFNERHFADASSHIKIASESIQNAPALSQPLAPEIDLAIENAFRAIIEEYSVIQKKVASSQLNALLRGARKLCKEGDLTKAESVLNRALRIDPDNVTGMRQLAKLYNETGRERMCKRIRKKINETLRTS